MPDGSILELAIDDLDLLPGEQAFFGTLADLRDGTLQPPPFLLPSEWIEGGNIHIKKGESSRPGVVRLHGYQREIVDCLVDPEVRRIAVLKSQQVGYSALVGWMAGYELAWEASSVMIAEPTDSHRDKFYKQSIDPLFANSPPLKELVRSPGRGEVQDTIEERRLSNGGVLRMVGATADDNFRLVRSRINFADEVDASGWLPSKSGDKFKLLEGRATDSWDGKLIVGGTPLLRKNSMIWREFEQSDQRKFFVQCPHCGTEQYLQFGERDKFGLQFEVDENDVVVDAWYMCNSPERCRIDEFHKEDIVNGGRWIPTAEPKKPGIRGYHIWAGYSFAPQASWLNICQEWVEACKNPDELMQPFRNLFLGEPYDEVEGKAVNPTGLSARTEAYPAEIPDGVAVLVAGVDKQKGSIDQDIGKKQRLEVSVWGFGRDEESWLIGHYIFNEHEIFSPESIAELDALLTKTWRKRDGTEMHIQATAIDLGGGYTQETKDYCRQRNGRNVWAIKGASNAIGTRSASVWPRAASRKNRNTWFMIDTQLAKDTIGIRLRKETAGAPGYMHFPQSVGPDYFESLTAEKLTIDKKTGLKHWEPKDKKKNSGEAWDCLVYCFAALQGLKQTYQRWSSLSLAAERDRIPKVLEIYSGIDRSAQSEDALLPPAPELASPRAQTASAPVEQKQVAPVVPMVASTKPVVQPQTRRLGIARSSFMSRR